MDRIAALLACHNRKEKTLNCLSALMAQEGLHIDFELSVYLVDDRSTDGTGAAVAERFPSVKVIPGNGHLYWNKGMHAAWQEAAPGNYDYYVWVNDDTALFTSSIQLLRTCAKEKKDRAIICGSFCSAQTGEWTYGGQKRTGQDTVPVKPSGKMEECDIINGNCVLIPRHVYETVGKLDPVYVHAIGDFDYGLRARKKDIRIFTTPDYVGYCEKHGSLPKWCLPEYPLRQRARNLYSPLGNAHPRYYFIFEYRHFGLFTAVKHYLTIHLRMLIPTLWK